MPTLKEIFQFIKKQDSKISELKNENKKLSIELKDIKRQYEALILEKERAIKININEGGTLRIDLEAIKNLRVVNDSSYKEVQVFACNNLIELNSIGNNNVIIGNNIIGKSNIECNNLSVSNNIVVQGEVNSVNTNIQSNRDIIKKIDLSCRNALTRAEQEYLHRYDKESYKY